MRNTRNAPSRRSGSLPLMYVCICNAIKDKEMSAAAGDDASTVADVFKRCGARPKCGKCLPDVAELIEQHQDAAHPARAIAAE